MTVTLVVLDSVGVDALPEADDFGDPARGGDPGGRTLDHGVQGAGLPLPNLTAMGPGNGEGVSSLPAGLDQLAAFGRLRDVARGARLALPNLAAVGLGSVEGVGSRPAVLDPLASFGRLREVSPGKDTTTGQWEFMGVVLQHPFRTYERFPDEVMAAVAAST